MYIRSRDEALATIFGRLIEFLFPKFGADVTFVIMMLIGLLFYVALYIASLFFIYKRQDRVEIYEIIIQELRSINIVKSFIILIVSIFFAYWFYRSMLLATIYDYPDLAIMKYLEEWVSRQSDLSYIVYFSIGAMALLVSLYFIGKKKD